MAKSKPSGNRHYNFCGICYSEHWEGFNKYLKVLTECGTIRAYYKILHKPDTEDKVEHVHFLIEFWDARTLSSVNKRIKKFCDVWRDGLLEINSDLREYARYLIHKDELDKIHYSPTEVDTNDRERYVLLINAENSNQIKADKVFLKYAYELINDRWDMCFADILEHLALNPKFSARLVKSYTVHLRTHFESRRYNQECERGLGRWLYDNNLEKIVDEVNKARKGEL